MNTLKLLTLAFSLSLATMLTSCKTAELQKIVDVLQQQQQQPLDNKMVVAGLKQALSVGTRNTVSQTSQQGGFSDNPLIRIALPSELNKVATTLNQVGLGSYVERFELQMNRAAELASIEARDIFIDSISQMTLADGWKILRGENDAATQYFRRTTEEKLINKFRLAITNSMNKVGFYGDYKKLLKTYDALPFTQKPDLNIENHILQQSLDGLFTLVAQEEQNIRQNPSARVTDLLRRVFAN